ncbi:3-methylcrotonyl-CoA carboxylase subunit alpha [Mesorhizobium sp. L-8-10]|uniref:acetyl/propionyl/methylcrotonyl-CoA carboxylase subunit alpha n=1 Tax=Mesorhizobium sp. L-8-10 TaxID=2744523 RepID=UPI0019257D15|nr:biotin carboxylase N-terminal domain-containing protein [Mesorhizobium sp. L-8-10]BCH30926.1 3-methylcrotonyl-CoA carboxylase subunit alpha [Mesorhizobium sp. L-8-10]
MTVRKLLIANRGEIACRVMRTARRMGIATVAVYSDADRDALHVATADEAVRIGGDMPRQSYLDIGAVIAAARQAGADAVHPGYGFLSENADFAEACLAAGLTFVGPSPTAIRAMGDKARAKALVEKAGVPVVPGYAADDQSAERLAVEADRIGYPLLIKAAAGGGGRGMRQVMKAADLPAAIIGARSEAENAFGDGSLLLERLVVEARHVEIQVFGDSKGNCIHLGERDCSTQRRHQKVVEEAPSPAVDAALRAALGADAVKAARAVDYCGAGTVEFIVGPDGSHFFLEMNTRLQVEHPVTEMIAGLDLVEWQLRVACGEELPAGQGDIALRGHAIEARLYAEDPYAGFLPQTGEILHWRPAEIERLDGIRVDCGVREGDFVTPFYDAMLAKIVAHGRDRDEATARLRQALRRAPLIGPGTNRTFLVDLLGTDEFVAGAVTTGLLDRWVADGAAMLAAPVPTPEDFALAAAILALASGGGWFRSTGVAECPITLRCGDLSRETVVRFERGRLAAILVDGVEAGIGDLRLALPQIRYTHGGLARNSLALVGSDGLRLDRDGRTFHFTEPDRLAARAAAADPSRVVSPVSGLVRAVAVQPGDAVSAGQMLVVVEAMKMETTLPAQGAGTVRAVHVAAGEQTRAGDLLIEIAVS